MADGKRELSGDHWVRGSAMIRCEHDAVALSERRAESFDAAALGTGDAVTPAEIERKDRAEEVPPQFATIRRDEAVGCRDKDVLHRSSEGGVGYFWVKRSDRF